MNATNNPLKQMSRITRRAAIALLPLALILAACAPGSGTTGGTYGSGTTPTQPAVAPAQPTSAPVEPTATTAAAVPVTGGTLLNVSQNSTLGSFLVGANGMTVYAFTKDTANKSNCTGQCIKNWPPVVPNASLTVGSGIDASKLGQTTLADGSPIVTYNQMPLYYFYKDTKAGDTNGQGVGSVWFTVSPEGKLIGQEAAGSTPAAASPTVAPTSVPQDQGGYSYGSGSGSSSGTAAPAASEAVINVATDPKLGTILVGANGMTLYAFMNDTPDKSNCNAGCLKLWPPLVTQGSPTLGAGVDASLVGSTTLADGSKVVTYNHMPLYYFVKDKKAGDVTGQGVGSVWFVVSPDGKAVQQ